MRCDICSIWVKNPHTSVRKTDDKLCKSCLVLTERMIFFGTFCLVANLKERKMDNSSHNKNQHWICTCGQHNHFSRGTCLNCGEYP